MLPCACPQSSARRDSLPFPRSGRRWPSYLSQKPIELGPAAAGLFGLGSAPGALAARYSGRLTDRYGPDTVNTVGLASAGIAFVVFLFAGDSVVALVIGCNLLGYGTTSAQIANQTRIFTGPAALRARLNTVYVFALFASGAIGSSIGLALLEAHGWTVMVWEGMAFLAVGALSLTVRSVRQRRTSGVQNSVETGPCVAVGRPVGKGSRSPWRRTPACWTTISPDRGKRP
ncbi:MFS transporter [Streptomyces sp. NPDC088560]|uniref:MFS transporter n=1 Tax=Streptomyces sp. NPDC088560 TaxID=3365868 RepID=UPI00382890D8